MRQLKNVKTSLGQKEKSANTMIDKSGFMSFMFRKRKKKMEEDIPGFITTGSHTQSLI